MRTELNSASRPRLDAGLASRTRAELSTECSISHPAGLLRMAGGRYSARKHSERRRFK